MAGWRKRARFANARRGAGTLLGLLVSLTCAGDASADPVRAKATAAEPPATVRPPIQTVRTLPARILTPKNFKPTHKPQTKPAQAKARAKPAPTPDACTGLKALVPKTGARPFAPGEELAYEMTVAGAYVGRFEIKVGKPRTVQGRTVLPLFGRARTNGFVSSFKTFSGRYMSMVDPETLLPLGTRVESTYGDEDRWEKVQFTDAQRGVTADFTLGGRELNRKYLSSHELTDILSMLYSARAIPLGPGVGACQDVFGARRLWRMKGTVEGEARVDTPAGTKDAYRVKTVFDRKPYPGLSSDKPPHLELDIYFAKDASRVPLLFVVKTEGVEARGRLMRWSLTSEGDDGWAL